MLAGLRKTSLVDYPGRVSSVLFLAGCDFRCPYCQNPALVEPGRVDEDGLLPIDEALAFLERRKGLVSGVVLSGGEPTLYDGLAGLVASIRAMGFLVKIDTNGSFPDRIASLGADYIAMDLKTDPERYAELWPGAPPDAASRVRAAVEAVRASGAEYEFRVTCAPGFVDASAADAIARLLKPADRVYLQRYSPAVTLAPAWAATAVPPTDAELQAILARLRAAAPEASIRGGYASQSNRAAARPS